MLWLNTNQGFVEFARRSQVRTAEQRQQKLDAAVARQRQEEARLQPQIERARAVILSKLGELRRARAACVGKWAVLDEERWLAEQRDFISTILVPALRAGPILTDSLSLRLIAEAMAGPTTEDPSALSGIEYEEFCAAILRDSGWSIETTKASGDQGVDLITTKGPWRVVIQCKRYAGSVPNSAVQEVTAGAALYGSNARAVVSTGSYTSSARTLADATGTLLLSDQQLPALEAILNSRRSPGP
jgi:hypothetical protein